MGCQGSGLCNILSCNWYANTIQLCCCLDQENLYSQSTIRVKIFSRLSLIYVYLSVLSRSSCFDDLYWVKLCKSLQRPIESNRNQYSFCSFKRKLFSLGDKIQRMSWGYGLLVWQNSLVSVLFVLNIMRYRLVSFLSPLEVSSVRKKSWLGSFGQSKIAYTRLDQWEARNTNVLGTSSSLTKSFFCSQDNSFNKHTNMASTYPPIHNISASRKLFLPRTNLISF